MPSIHNFPGVTSSDIYDLSQTTEGIKDGDVLVMNDAIAIMVQAWPTLYQGEQGQLHTLAIDKGYAWETMNDGKYIASVELAESVKLDEMASPAAARPKH